MEGILPLERQISSLRIAIQEGLTEEENAKLKLQKLEALNEKRLDAQQCLECYQNRLSSTFNKRVNPRSFQVGDLVPFEDLSSQLIVQAISSLQNGMDLMLCKKSTPMELTS